LSRFVLDASAALGWVADSPPTPYALSIKQSLLKGARAVVPTLWHLEMANWFALAKRRRVLDESQASLVLSALDAIVSQTIDTETEVISIRQVLQTANRFKLSAYDASYLDLAQQEGLPLATLDQRLRAAAKTAGVELFQLAAILKSQPNLSMRLSLPSQFAPP
jgi:predicted nucleic acid-binding protein